MQYLFAIMNSVGPEKHERNDEHILIHDRQKREDEFVQTFLVTLKAKVAYEQAVIFRASTLAFFWREGIHNGHCNKQHGTEHKVTHVLGFMAINSNVFDTLSIAHVITIKIIK